MIVKSDGRRNSLPFYSVCLHVTFNIVVMIKTLRSTNHYGNGCLQGHWPVYLANKEILFGIIDDLLTTETYMFHFIEPECLMCYLEARFDADDLVYYTIQYLGRYCDVFIRIHHNEKGNQSLHELHLTCKQL